MKFTPVSLFAETFACEELTEFVTLLVVVDLPSSLREFTTFEAEETGIALCATGTIM